MSRAGAEGGAVERANFQLPLIFSLSPRPTVENAPAMRRGRKRRIA